MPKHRKTVKHDGQVFKFNTPKKFRIGYRDNGVCAHTMSTEDLNAVLASKDKARWHRNARVVLALRGVAA